MFADKIIVHKLLFFSMYLSFMWKKDIKKKRGSGNKKISLI